MCPPSERVEHRAHARQVGDDIDRLRVDRPAPREGEQMPGEPGATRDGAPHGFEHRAAGGGSPVALEQLQAVANTASRLLKSCATPLVSWPSDSIFCAWRSASSAVRSRSWSRSRSVTS